MQQDPAVGGEHDVGRVQVAEDQAAFVDGLQGLLDALEHALRPVDVVAQLLGVGAG